ncbi:MAG: hypothetical protein ACK5PP_02110, partial [Acidimicrobiales bacterium]
MTFSSHPRRSSRFGLLGAVASGLDRRPEHGTWMLITMLFFGLGWSRAAAEKVIDPAWWNGSRLADFVADHTDHALGWYRPFLVGFVGDHTVTVAAVVVVLQLVAAVTLLTGWRLEAGLAAGMLFNLHFPAAGAVNPSAFYLIGQGAVALALCQATGRPSHRILLAAEIGVVALAVASAPSLRTLHPAEVIEDPAAMVFTVAALVVIGGEVLRFRHVAAGVPAPALV